MGSNGVFVLFCVEISAGCNSLVVSAQVRKWALDVVPFCRLRTGTEVGAASALHKSSPHRYGSGSDVGFLKFNMEICKITVKTNSINRQMRSIVWLVKMFLDYFYKGRFSPEEVTNQFVYGIRNDKAFAASGFVTNYYMSCAELFRPRITKNEIKKIIKGGGEKLLSPERRFDAIVFNSPELFC